MAFDEVVYHRLTDVKRREVVKRLRGLLENKVSVKLAYVFGSFTRRRSVRDVDVAVYTVPPLTFDEFLELGAELEIALRMPVDVAQIRSLDPAFRLKILREGLPLVVGSTDLHNGLLAQAFSELRDYEIEMTRSSELKRAAA